MKNKINFMMYSTILVIILLSFILFVHAKTVSSEEFEIVLQKVLLQYFEDSSSSPLTEEELQDLLAAFLETPEGQDVDLSKVGKILAKQ